MIAEQLIFISPSIMSKCSKTSDGMISSQFKFARDCKKQDRSLSFKAHVGFFQICLWSSFEKQSWLTRNMQMMPHLLYGVARLGEFRNITAVCLYSPHLFISYWIICLLAFSFYVLCPLLLPPSNVKHSLFTTFHLLKLRISPKYQSILAIQNCEQDSRYERQKK